MKRVVTPTINTVRQVRFCGIGLWLIIQNRLPRARRKMSTQVWSDEEVATLLSVWGDEHIQEQLDGATRNIKVYAAIAQKLLEAGGYHHTAVQCCEKVKKLKAEYKQIKTHYNRSRRNRETCKFLPQLEAILGHRPASSLPAVLESSSNQVYGELDEDVTSSHDTLFVNGKQ